MSSLIILLHGVGSSGDNMTPLGQAMAPALPDTVFASPNAPSPRGYGYEWFSIAGVTEANRPERIRAARPSFDSVLDAIIAQHGFADRLDKVALIGFSQGSIMALDLLATGRKPLGAVVAFSGRLASPEPLQPTGKTPVLLIHGDADPVMPAEESVRTSQRLAELGVSTELVIEPGLGHQISANGLAEAGAFLRQILV